MNEYNIIFSLNKSDKIVIELEEPLSCVHCCYQAFLTFYCGNKKYVFPSESIRYMIQCLIPLLEKALKKELGVDKSISNLGYSENECYQNKPNLIYHGKRWIGINNLLWSGKGFSTWLYNDDNGTIILEITPVYTYPTNDPDEQEHYVPYDQWIKGYKTCFVAKIPPAVAEKWLEQAQFILHSIEATMAREKKMYENNQGKDLTTKWYEILEKEYTIVDPHGVDANKVPTEFFTDEWWKKRGL